jgi:Domain of unknown function (DUF5658)
MLKAAIAFISLNLADALTTITALNMGLSELNPLITLSLEKMGVIGLFCVKMASIVLFLFAVSRASAKSPKTAKNLLLAGNILLAVIVMANTILIWRNLY